MKNGRTKFVHSTRYFSSNIYKWCISGHRDNPLSLLFTSNNYLYKHIYLVPLNGVMRRTSGGWAGDTIQYKTRLQYLYTYYNGYFYTLCAKIKLKWKFPSMAG